MMLPMDPHKNVGMEVFAFLHNAWHVVPSMSINNFLEKNTREKVPKKQP